MAKSKLKRRSQKVHKVKPNTPGEVLRQCGHIISEIRKPDGELHLEISPIDSEVRTSGKMRMMDNLYYMVKYHIEDQCGDLRKSMEDAAQLRDQRGDEMAELVGKNITLEVRCKNLEAAIEKISKELQAGKLSPYSASKQLKELNQK